MNRAWVGLEKAPQGTVKNKIYKWAFITHSFVFWAWCLLLFFYLTVWYIYRLGLGLLSRVKPSEMFLKSISKEVTNVQITYPSRFHFFSSRFCFYENEMLITLFSMQSFIVNQSFTWVVIFKLKFKNYTFFAILCALWF